MRRSSLSDLSLGEEEVEKRQKHNMAEKRRRSLIADTLQHLASLVDCSSKDQKSIILRRACDTVQKLQEKVAHLSAENNQLKGQRSTDKQPRRRPSSDALHLSLSPLSIQPISPLVKRELGLHEFDSRVVFHYSAVGLIIVNLLGHVLDCNGRFCDIVGCTKTSLLENTLSFFDPVHPAYLAVSPSFVTNLVERPSQTLRFRKRLLSSDAHINVQVTCWAILAGEAGQSDSGKKDMMITKSICILVEPLDDGPPATGEAAPSEEKFKHPLLFDVAVNPSPLSPLSTSPLFPALAIPPTPSAPCKAVGEADAMET